MPQLQISRREVAKTPTIQSFVRFALKTVSVLAIAAVMQSNTALADGGDGGGTGGGTGGTLANPQGGDAVSGSNGGGGGGGPGAGSGGDGDGTGGEGGGGGFHGFTGAALPGGSATGTDGFGGTAASDNNGGGGGGGAGGYGVLIVNGSGGTVNAGQIFQGGTGGDGAGWGGSGGDGGLGMFFSTGDGLASEGSILGGDGGEGQGGTLTVGNGGDGGAGLDFTGRAFVNDNEVRGGNGARGGTSGGNGGAGGDGLIFDGQTLSNTGVIVGGVGFQGASGGGRGGDGGTAVVVEAGTLFVNTAGATIEGGAAGQGGSGGGAGGNGGDGIRGDNIVIINSGTIRGGRYGNDGSGGGNDWGENGYAIRGSNLTVVNTGSLLYSGTNGVNSVQFTGGTNLLTLGVGYEINGNVVADGTNDTLEIAGNEPDVGQFDLGGRYTGFEAFEKSGSGIWELIGNSSNTLTHLDVLEGEVRNRSNHSMDIDVAAGATLSGGATVGNVIIGDDAILSPGTASNPLAVGTYNMASLQLSPGSIINFDLGFPASSEKIAVQNGLTLDGTLNVSANTGFGSMANNGVYTLIEYGNLVANNGLDLGTLPAGYTYEIGVGSVVADAVTLTVSTASGPQYWDGMDSTAGIDGGTGTWNASNTNWTNASGTTDEAWRGDFAIFAGAAGTVTVEGAQTFTGMQFLTNGYEIVAGANGEMVTNTAATNFRLGTGITAEIAAPISGTGGLVKQEDGTLILSGMNSYSGDTTVSDGTLQLGTATSQGKIVGEVSIQTDATLDVVNADTSGVTDIDVFESSLVFRNGTTAGTATIEVTDGSVQFRDISSAQNATITNDGFGDVSFSQSATAGSASITNNQWMNFYNSSTAGNATITNNDEIDFFDNATAGNATLVNNAGGEINFARSSGPLGDGQISAGSIAGAGLFYLGSNTLTVGANDSSTTVSGVISDCGPTGSECLNGATGGSLLKTGIGELTLTGENTYTGLTTIDQGTLSLGNGGAGGSVAGDIFNDNNFLVFNRSDDFTYDGIISGSGSISFIGTGTTILTGDSGAFSGPVFVNAGNLQLISGSSSLGASELTVAANGTISGVGTVEGDLTVNGTVSPGNSIGTINVLGDLTFNAGSTYEVEVDAPDMADLIDVTGTATINGGEVVVTKLSNEVDYQGGQSYTIIEADSGIVRNADFTYANPFLFLSSDLVYGANTVSILLQGGGGGSQDFTSVAQTYNQFQSAMALNDLEASGDALVVFNELQFLTDADAARRAFDLASGEIHASGQHLVDRTAPLFGRMLRRRAESGLQTTAAGAPAALGYAAEEITADGVTTFEAVTTAGYAMPNKGSAWIAPLGATGTIDADGNAGALDWWIGGLAGGYEHAIDLASGKGWLGIGFGYMKSHGSVDARLSETDADNYQIGVYGGMETGPWSFTGSLFYAASNISTERGVVFGGGTGGGGTGGGGGVSTASLVVGGGGAINRVASADYWAHSFGVSGEAAYGVTVAPGTTISPLVTLDAGWSGHGGFTETGAGALNLTAASQSWGRFDTGLGLELAHMTADGKAKFTVRAVWEHAFADATPSQNLSFAGSPTSFAVNGPDAGRDRVRLGAGAAFQVTDDIAFRAQYDGLFSGDQSSHGANLSLSVAF